MFLIFVVQVFSFYGKGKRWRESDRPVKLTSSIVPGFFLHTELKVKSKRKNNFNPCFVGFQFVFEVYYLVRAYLDIIPKQKIIFQLKLDLNNLNHFKSYPWKVMVFCNVRQNLTILIILFHFFGPHCLFAFLFFYVRLSKWFGVRNKLFSRVRVRQ